MNDERSLEERALRVSELAGELVAARISGVPVGERQALLAEIRRQIEALEAQATQLSVRMIQEKIG